MRLHLRVDSESPQSPSEREVLHVFQNEYVLRLIHLEQRKMTKLEMLYVLDTVYGDDDIRSVEFQEEA